MTLSHKLHRVIAIGLMAWCAGAGCMLVSYAHGAAMAHEDMASARAESSAWAGLTASAGVHSCCKARHSSQPAPLMAHRHASNTGDLAEVSLLESLNPANAMSCCPLTSGTFVVSARQSVSDDRAADAIRSSGSALVLADVAATPIALPLRLPNQDQTYLRHCSFLI